MAALGRARIMSRLKRNVFANLVGNLWGSLISFFFVPIYIHYVGMEGWGLIGFSITLQSIFALADMGLGTALNREFARTSARDDKPQHRHDLLRTLEIVYWLVASAGGALVIAAAPLLATRWLHARELPIATVQGAIMLMGVLATLQLPLTLYAGGLLGLQQQVRLNVINVVLWTIRSVGSVAVLALIAPTVLAYFVWQAIISAIHTGVIAIAVWRSLGPAERPAAFRRDLFKSIRRFSVGIIGITATATLLMQTDKIILSRMLTLEAFGYYALASTVAGALYRVSNPVFVSFFPRFTELITLRDTEGLKIAYHAGAQLIAVLVAPIAAVISLFSRELLFLWTRNAVTADRTHLILSLLVIGSALNGIVSIPYALQLAHGWTRLTFLSNVIAAVAMAPLIAVLAVRWGAIGAAAVWIAINAGYMAITVGIMHRRLLPGEEARWYLRDVAMPVAAAVAVTLAARAVFPSTAGWATQVIGVGAVLACAFAAAGLAAPATRQTAESLVIRFGRLAVGRGGAA